MDLPKTHQFGSTELVEVTHLETTFSISRRTAMKYLKVLHIQPLHIGKEIYFSISTFNRIMYVLTRPGSPGFLFPGSSGKQNKRLLKDTGYITEITEELLTLAASPQIMAEMAAASGNDPSMVKKLMAAANAKSRKEPKK
jgi:hypothetical protein